MPDMIHNLLKDASFVLRRKKRMAGFCAILLVLGLSSCVSVNSRNVSGPDFGPVYGRDIAPDGSNRVKAFGPFVEKQVATNGMTFTACRPFYSRTSDSTQNRKLQEYVWPLGIIKSFQNETYWHMLLAFFGHDFDENDSGSRYRAVLFPFIFAGRDINKENYFAFFPVGGTIHEFLGQDRIVFLLFPLYLSTAINGVETRDVLWPFFSKTKGKDISRFRVFPFYMVSKKGERLESRSIMWPFWTSTRHNAPGDEGYGYVFFPFCGHAKFTNQETWMFLPPFFRFTDSRKDGKSGNFPWPLIQYSARNPEKFYIWPIWGYKDFPGVKSSFFLWPIVNAETIERPEVKIKRLSVIPFAFYESSTRTSRMDNVEDKSGEDNVTGRYFKLWPLASYCREGDNFRFRTLELWPARQTGGIERNWAPLWTLYSHVRAGQNSEDEILWGLYRRANHGEETRQWSIFPLFSWKKTSDNGGSREWNVFMGLLGYKREDLLKTYRLLYFLKFKAKKGEPKP